MIALVRASLELSDIFKFGVYPQYAVYGYHEDVTLVLCDTNMPICNIEVKKTLADDINNIAREHLQQMFLYAFYFMKNSLHCFHSILTNFKVWYGFRSKLSDIKLVKVTHKYHIKTNHDLFNFLNCND